MYPIVVHVSRENANAPVKSMGLPSFILSVHSGLELLASIAMYMNTKIIMMNVHTNIQINRDSVVGRRRNTWYQSYRTNVHLTFFLYCPYLFFTFTLFLDCL